MLIIVHDINACCFLLFSALLGYATTVIPHWVTHYVASGLFAVFGLKMLKEGQCLSRMYLVITRHG